MSSPTPLQSFIGGLSLALPVHALLLLNGNVFGISGFIHRAARGGKEAAGAVAGLVLAGAFVGATEGVGPQSFALGLPLVLLSGFLVGLGSKLSNGCTSGHMIAGISRLSFRSIIATATFLTTGAITAHFLHRGLPPVGNFDWTLGAHGKMLLALQTIPLIMSIFLYFYVPAAQPPSTEGPDISGQEQSSLRFEPARVLSFLLLPFHKAFDPSLAFLATGAMPLAIFLYQYYRRPEKPRLGGSWAIPTGKPVDIKLLSGAAMFGVGWGISGICPGPGLVNLGRAISSGSDLLEVTGWLGAVALGGLVA